MNNCTSEAYLEPSRASMMELFCENCNLLQAVKYFPKKLCRRFSTGLQICLCTSPSFAQTVFVKKDTFEILRNEKKINRKENNF